MAVSTGEFVREAVRKPYILYNVVLGNQILPASIPAMRRDGYLESGTWTKALVVRQYPQVLNQGKIDGAKLAALPQTDRQQLGRVLFQYHCNDCHAAEAGFAALGHTMRGWTREMIRALVLQPEKAHFFMPPWAGSVEEAELLTDYLMTIAPPFPRGMNFGQAQTD